MSQKAQIASPQRRRHSLEFKRKAVERLQRCDSVVALARDLGIHWGLLYKWKRALEAATAKLEKDAAAEREAALREEIARLKNALADKVMEADFFKGALQNIEARRRSQKGSGGQPFTTRPGR